jgi:NAD(P)-dependent dehydrogenase (short-subunit alcohol dehydrogenase family)
MTVMTGPTRGYDYSGCNVFVAGGTSGINLAIAVAFASAGARVGVLSRKAENLAIATTRLRVHDAGALGFQADVRDAGAVSHALASFAEAVGAIDVLVSGAAGNFLAPAKDLSPNGFKVVVDIDVLGTFNVMRAAYAHLRKPGACIINLSAPQSYMPIALQVHACAAKAGVDQITRVLAKEWGPDGVRVNSISPGPIAATEGLDRLAPKPSGDGGDRVVQSVPLRRYGTVEDICAMALFLASSDASYVSGVVIPVDGGWGLGGSGGSS